MKNRCKPVLVLLAFLLILQESPVTCQDENRFTNYDPAQRFRSIVIPNEQQQFNPYNRPKQNEDLFLQRPQWPQPTRQPQQPLNGFYNTRPGFQTDSGYRFAPPVQRLGPNDFPYVISEERLRELRSEFMYWYFDKGGDDDNGDLQIHIHHSNAHVHKNFNFQLPFFGFRFNYTRVSLHGYLEFSDPAEHYVYPLVFPNKDWPRKNDPSFIGVFYSKCRIGEIRPEEIDRRRPGVYFRMERDLQGRTDRFGIEFRERLMWDIREGVVGSDTFVPKHAVIVTWKNISFAGGIGNALYTTNTFQLVLATDEVYTYAIFNYAEMMWTSHTEAGGDTTTGEGGVPAYVGFNAGNGTRSFEYYPYSQRSTIRDLVGRGWANGFPGRHIFRIDENIMLGSCNKDIAGTTLPLVFAPESGNMLGGTIVNISGPCFEPNMKVRCKFDTEEVIGRVIDRNRVVCVQPFLLVEGYIVFDIAIGDEKYNWKGMYFVETPATATEKISLELEDNQVHKTETQKPFVITWSKQNLTTNYDARLKLSIWGYRETTIKPELLSIDILEENIPNTGTYTIFPEVYVQRNNYEVLDLSFGFLRLTVTDPNKYFKHGLSPVLWSKPIPLGWYFKPQWERQYGTRWSEKLCDNWLKNDRYLKNFAAEIPQCPCVLEQALADKGRYMPDYNCDMEVNRDCFYNKGARHCVRSGAPSLEGSEQQCCYDKNNYLMLSYDQQWGSKPRRSHNLGYLPWNEANKVPTLSQWFHDVSPFYFCCYWQDEQAVGCETYRFERRPSQDCVAYQSPYVASVFGDLHFITFDDIEYTFNGKGEFVLVHADTDKHKLDVQGRFEQVSRNIYGPVMATHLTSVAARDNASSIIEVRLRPRDAQWRYRLDVFADNKRIYFDRLSLKVQHFHGVTVYTPSYVLDQSEVIIMFESGVGVEVLENKGSMSARIYLPWKFINQTRGLLGTWNFNPMDDFTLPDGMTIAVNRGDFRSIHENFGMAWLLEDRYEKYKGGALFVRENGRTASYYANRTFQPEFGRLPQEIIPVNRSQDVVTANKICGDSYQCKYDYAVSLNEESAKNTLKYQDSFVNIKSRNKERVISCGVLETPRFGRKSNFLFTPGTKVTFECNQDFVLIGDQRRTCTAEGRWDLPEYGYTECLRLLEYESRTAWMSIAVVSLILVPLFILVCCLLGVCHRKSRKQGLKMFWNFSSAPALRRRSSVLALSSLDINENGNEPRTTKSARDLNRDYLSVKTNVDPSSAPQQLAKSRHLTSSRSPTWLMTTSSPLSSTDVSTELIAKRTPKQFKRTYDGVYRTHEPLPGQQEFSSRTLWIVVPIMLLILGPLFFLLVCTGYRIIIAYAKSSSRNDRKRSGSVEIFADIDRPTETRTKAESRSQHV